MAQESDSPKTGRATRNVLNVAEIDEYTALIAEGEAPHIRDWLTSTFSRWLKNECEDVRICVDARLWEHPLMHIANTFFSQIVRPEEGRQSLLEVRDRMARPVQVLSQPQWLGNALATGQIVYEVDIDAYVARDTVPHMKDFMRTLPERPIRMSIPQMVEAILAWDARLAKQEAISDLSEGVTLVESPLFDETPYFMVKLDSKDSYTNEGAAMRHCVASYAGRKNTSIYSLRSAQETRPVATIEITKGALIQCKGFANATVSDEVRRIVDAWVTASGFKLHAPSPTRRVRRGGGVYGDWEIEINENGDGVFCERDANEEDEEEEQGIEDEDQECEDDGMEEDEDDWTVEPTATAEDIEARRIRDAILATNPTVLAPRSADSTRTARMRRTPSVSLERVAADPTANERERAAALKEIARRAAPDLARDAAGEISSTENPLHRVTFATLRRMVVNPQSVTERRLALLEINRRADEHRNVGNNRDTRADGVIPDGSFG